MKTVVLPTHNPALFNEAVGRAAELLKAGESVALPTETVYGLAANALDSRAVAQVFEVKGRPSHNPVIVHVASVKMALRCVSGWPASADQLAAAFWPGPLTLVLPRSREIPDIVTAGGSTVGVRWPSHPFIQEVIRACGFPLAVPSANPASAVSPTNAGHVLKSLGGKIPLIVDGGQAQVGIESTVLDLCSQPPRVLRPGMIDAAVWSTVVEMEGRAGNMRAGGGKPRDMEDAPLRSPGQFVKHYAPKARLVIWEWRDETDLQSQVSNANFPKAGTNIIAHTKIPTGEGYGRVSVLPHDPAAYARAIYAELHRCDDTGAQLIVVEALPAEARWHGIADRLRRAGAVDLSHR